MRFGKMLSRTLIDSVFVVFAFTTAIPSYAQSNKVKLGALSLGADVSLPDKPSAKTANNDLQGQTPRIEFKSLRLNIGEMWRGERRKASFEFTNKGDGVLQIRSIHASCGCLDTKVEADDTFAPNESGRISFEFDSTNFAGSILRTITVDTNAPTPSTVTLTVTARINQEVWTSPSLINLGNLVHGKTQEWSVEVFADKHVDLIAVESSSPKILSARLDKSSGKNKVLVKLVGNAPIGHFRERVTLKNSSSHLKDLVIPVIGEVIGHVKQSAQYIEFGVVDKQDVIKRSFTLRSDQADFKVEGVDIDLRRTDALKAVKEADVLKSSYSKVADGFLLSFEMRLPSTLPKESKAINASGTFVVRTNDSDYKTIRVPFFGVLKQGE